MILKRFLSRQNTIGGACATNHPRAVFDSWYDEFTRSNDGKDVKLDVLGKCGCLSTVGKICDNETTMHCNLNIPNSRMISIVDIDSKNRFVYGSTLTSQKSKEIKENPCVSLNFNWFQTHKAVKINGIVTLTNVEIANQMWQRKNRQREIFFFFWFFLENFSTNTYTQKKKTEIIIC